MFSYFSKAFSFSSGQDATYNVYIEDNDLNKELLKRYAEHRKHEEERVKWQTFLAGHESLITVQEVCTYLVHNKILEPADPILSKYPMVPFRFISPMFKKIACPLCGEAGGLKYDEYWMYTYTSHVKGLRRTSNSV